MRRKREEATISTQLQPCLFLTSTLAFGLGTIAELMAIVAGTTPSLSTFMTYIVTRHVQIARGSYFIVDIREK